MAIPAMIVWRLQMRIKDKVAVVTLFWLRIMYHTPCSAFFRSREWCGLTILQCQRDNDHSTCHTP